MNYVLIWCSNIQNPYQVLGIIKSRPAWMNGLLNLPGGKIEEGETPEQAAIRELYEETGFSAVAKPKTLGRLIDNESVIYCVRVFVSATDNPKNQEGDPEVPLWINLPKFLNDPRVIPNLKVIVPLMICGVTDWVIRDDLRANGVSHLISVEIPRNM